MFMNNTFHGTTVDDKNFNAMNIKFWLWWNASFLPNIPWKFCTNRNIFHRDMKEKTRVGVFVWCSDKRNTHSLFLLYLGGKCFDLYEIFRVCLWVIMHSIEVKIKYSLVLRTRKHFIKSLSLSWNPLFRKHVNMTSELRHREQRIFNLYIPRIFNSS